MVDLVSKWLCKENVETNQKIKLGNEVRKSVLCVPADVLLQCFCLRLLTVSPLTVDKNILVSYVLLPSHRTEPESPLVFKSLIICA